MEGRTALNGDMPVNPDGGLKAKGHPVGATGAAMAYEMFLQLRGQAGKHQVDGAMIGLVQNVGTKGLMIFIMDDVSADDAARLLDKYPQDD